MMFLPHDFQTKQSRQSSRWLRRHVGAGSAPPLIHSYLYLLLLVAYVLVLLVNILSCQGHLGCEHAGYFRQDNIMASGMHNASISPDRLGVLIWILAFSTSSTVLSILIIKQHFLVSCSPSTNARRTTTPSQPVFIKTSIDCFVSHKTLHDQ